MTDCETPSAESERLLSSPTETATARRSGCAPRGCARAAVVLVAAAVLAASVAGVALYVARHGGAGERVVAPDDARIEYIGRWDTRDAAAPAFAWSGSGFRVAVAGSASATLLLAHGNAQQDPWVRVWVDGVAQRAQPLPRTAALHVALGARAATHTLRLAKLSEARTGAIALTGIRIERRGRLVSPSANESASSGATERYLEFVGDSITCGFGVLGANATCPFTLATEDPTRAYSWLLGEWLRARAHAVAWSGRGVAWNYACGAAGAEMPAAYRHLFGAVDGREPAWAFRGPG